MKKSNILQIDNRYIQEELRKTQLNKQEKNKKNRFMGMILVLVVFLFTLPTYNLVQSYQKLREQEKQLSELKVRYEELVKQKEKESDLVNKLKNEEYISKYIRAKYQYSKEDEFIYNIPGLLPK